MADGEAGAKALNASRMGTSAVDFSAEVAPAWLACRESKELSWIALGYEGKKAIKLLGSGDAGGYAGLRPLLADDTVTYGAFTVTVGGAMKRVFISRNSI
jgi:hypothetical protein